jgi:hypothetical protein
MIHLEALDATIARLDMALLRVEGSPNDPLAAHELDFCLDLLASQHLPSGLGADLDSLLQQAMHLARQIEPDTVPSHFDSGHLRSLLLDIAAKIAILTPD